MTGGHIEPVPYYEYQTQPWGQTKCRVVDLHGITGYEYNCVWDNFHYHQRCRPKGGKAEWINVDFTNDTGHDRNDLHWRFAGAIPHKILEVYSDKFPHVEIAGTGGEDNATTLISWSGYVIPPGSEVHCGVRPRWATTLEDKKPFAEPAHWSSSGEEMEAVPGCASVDLVAHQPGAVMVRVSNTADSISPWLWVGEFSYALLPDKLELDQLRWDWDAEMPIQWVEESSWGGEIGPRGSINVGTIPYLGWHPDRYLITKFAVNWVDGTPESHAGHMIVQRHIGVEEVAKLFGVSVPTLTGWGMLILALSLGTAAKIYFRRRRPSTS